MERSNTPYWMTLRRYAEDSGAGQGGGERGFQINVSVPLDRYHPLWYRTPGSL